MAFSTWLWLATVIALLVIWEYRILRRMARYKAWKAQYMPWLDKIEAERGKFDPSWEDVPPG
jgi:hypothetical protein